MPEILLFIGYWNKLKHAVSWFIVRYVSFAFTIFLENVLFFWLINLPLGKLNRAYLTKHLLLRLPIISFIQTYSVSTGVSDLIAGISVGLILIPQGIAFAVLADLPPAYGLYSSIMGCFIYLIIGASPELSIAPTSILSLMSGLYSKGNLNVAIFQSFLGGILIVACGLFHLGNLSSQTGK